MPTSGDGPARTGDGGPRARMVRTAAQLIRRQGVSGTGMREVVAAADAPRGSLGHYFPEGKTQLVSEALTMMGGVAVRRVERAMAQPGTRAPSDLLEALVEDWRRDMTREQFTAGCPLVAAAVDTASNSEVLRETIQGAFDEWLRPLTGALARLGVPRKRAGRLSLLVVSALEGAIILARIRQELDPLDAVAAELGPLLDASVTRR